MSKEDSIMDDKEFKKEWIHQCLMEFPGLKTKVVKIDF